LEIFSDRKRLFESIVESTDDGVMVLDKQSRIQFVNKAMEKMTGHNKKELVGKYCRDLAPILNCDGICPVNADFEKDLPWSNVTSQENDKGEIRHLLVTASPLKDDGGVVGCVEIITDITERRLAEESLKESAYFLEESQRVAKLGTYVLDITKGSWNSSEYLDGIFGIGPNFKKDVKGWEKLLHPDDRKDMLDYFNNFVVKERKPFDKEYRIINQKDKKVRWVHGLGELDFNEDGEPVKMIGTIQDITQRKKAEKDLLESEEKFKHLVKSSPDAIYIMDKGTGKIVDVNKATEELLGYNKKEIIDTKAGDRVVSSQKSEFKKKFSNQKKKGEFHGEFDIKRKDGSIITIDAKGSSYGNYLFAFARDISIRKKAEDQLKNSEDFLKNVIDNSGDAIIATDKNQRVVLWSKGAEGLYGFNANEVVGKKISFLYPEEFKESRKKWQKEVLSGETVRNITTKIFNREGNVRDISLTLSPMRDLKGKSIGTIGVSKDITDSIKAEEALHEKIEELEKWQRLTVGREIRMVELKREIQELKEKTKKPKA